MSTNINEASSDNNLARKTVEEFATLITNLWDKQVSNIIEIGRLFEQASQRLKHGKWSLMFEKNLVPCSQSTADMYRDIARHSVLSNSQNSRNLPRSWYSLWLLRKIPDDELKQLIADGTVHDEMTLAEVKGLTKKRREEGDATFNKLTNALEVLLKLRGRFPDTDKLATHLLEGRGQRVWEFIETKSVIGPCRLYPPGCAISTKPAVTRQARLIPKTRIKHASSKSWPIVTNKSGRNWPKRRNLNRKRQTRSGTRPRESP